MKYYIIGLPDEQEIPKNKTRYMAIPVKGLKFAKEVPEITGTCIDTEGLMKLAKAGVRFYKIEPE